MWKKNVHFFHELEANVNWCLARMTYGLPLHTNEMVVIQTTIKSTECWATDFVRATTTTQRIYDCDVYTYVQTIKVSHRCARRNDVLRCHKRNVNKTSIERERVRESFVFDARNTITLNLGDAEKKYRQTNNNTYLHIKNTWEYSLFLFAQVWNHFKQLT